MFELSLSLSAAKCQILIANNGRMTVSPWTLFIPVFRHSLLYPQRGFPLELKESYWINMNKHDEIHQQCWVRVTSCCCAHLILSWPQAAPQGMGTTSQDYPQQTHQQEPPARVYEKQRRVLRLLHLAHRPHYAYESETVPALPGSKRPQSLWPRCLQ